MRRRMSTNFLFMDGRNADSLADSVDGESNSHLFEVARSRNDTLSEPQVPPRNPAKGASQNMSSERVKSSYSSKVFREKLTAFLRRRRRRCTPEAGENSRLPEESTNGSLLEKCEKPGMVFAQAQRKREGLHSPG